MTPAAINTAARRRLNAVSSSFWSDAEVIEDCLYFALMDLCTRVKCYERINSATSTVIGTSDYSQPTGTIEIKQVTYDNQKLERMDQREYFAQNLTGTTAIQGRPTHYMLWGNTVSLFPTPDEVKVLKFWFTSEPEAVSSGTDLAAICPVQFHPRLTNGVAYYMILKETADPRIPVFENRWLNRDIPDCVDEFRRKKHSDKLPHVRLEETSVTQDTGIV